MAAGSSNLRVDTNDEYLYASITNVSNFVSIKLSGNEDYPLWKAQMLCLMESHNMRGVVDDTFAGPKKFSKKIPKQYDSLLRGWIFGSISKDVLVKVFDLSSAKAVWDTLSSIYDPTPEPTPEPTPVPDQDTLEIEIIREDVVSKETKDTILPGLRRHMMVNRTAMLFANYEQDQKLSKDLHKATIEGDWSKAESILRMRMYLVERDISADGSNALHIAVGIGHNDFLRNLLSYMNQYQVLERRRSDGCTALHIAAIVGNTYAADLLVKKNKTLLRIEDNKDEEPLHKAYENMHLDTIGYLLKAMDDDNNDAKGKGQSSLSKHSVHPHLNPGVEIGVDLLVNAISAKQNNLASELIKKFPKFASKKDDVLIAIAKSFPSGLNYGETLIYPGLDYMRSMITYTARDHFIGFFKGWGLIFTDIRDSPPSGAGEIGAVIVVMLLLVLFKLGSLLCSIFLLILLVICYSFLVFYSFMWKCAKIFDGPIKDIEKKKKEWDEAKTVLELVCDEIDKLNYNKLKYYNRPILEAACQNAYKVVDEILFRSPEAIQSTDENGYDIIQLAIIYRSERIYNLIYDIGERKNLYRTIIDSSENNILHLAGGLAPTRELHRRRGAALQLQRELQWLEEVKKHVFPTYITKENIFKETPDMVFTREHENLLKEGEQWMKTTAESCSITAALITTIVFAAAITVPGGSDQEKGIPLFTEDVAFIIFAISDAISLFASSTALLVFLSILTARFAEMDFLVSLPNRLLIGLFSLLLSTIAMMVAFSATLFLVFCHKKPWMLAPICVLAFIPIGFFAKLQFPLIVDLFQSTHLRIFGKQRKSALRRFNPDNIRLLFRK